MTAQRRCYLCRRPVAERAGVYSPSYGILAHATTCQPIVAGELRSYDRSRRGRWRPRRDVLARLRTYWPAEATSR